ncbi:hypothetical protein LSH36_1185g00068 [Paralvinella palmiformis]|uniref:Poly [ADP-ribose] polymerase n=1 Tax=Paralvinella palmiformis TaxID=53620 RepID=A0AAD9MS42_9ANNE|nr:hypothetical protein LSH36_1185g00068 [Paralvinella palmiformis]
MRRSVSKSESGQQRTEQPQERSIGLKEEKKGYRNDQLRENMTAKQKTTEKVDSWRDIHLYDDKEERFICEANLRKQCRYGAQMCTKHHYPLPYLWQIKVNDIWEVTTENSSIEAAYCDPNMESVSYFDSLPYQDIIEAKYLAKEVACFAEIAQFPYPLDLINMVQINTVTGKQRRIKRRPKLITAEEILLGGQDRKVANLVRHLDKAMLPFGWAPMNTNAYTIPDLILVTEKSSSFAMIFEKFFATMDQTRFKIDYIFRIQNLGLWEKYIRKKREMQLSVHLKGNANEKSLFHGVSNQEIVRCICREGFDWRVCGKHGTLYGNGSYFARDASYSNNYSIKNRSRKRQMFLSLVLVGAYTQGEQNVTRPPQLYNSCVDDMTDPNIYVIFHDDQSYPEYLIEYKSV